MTNFYPVQTEFYNIIVYNDYYHSTTTNTDSTTISQK